MKTWWTYMLQKCRPLQRGTDMPTKPDSPTCRVPLRFRPTACAAGIKPEKRGKSLLSKSPSGTGDLDDTVKKRKKRRPLRLCSHKTLPAIAPSSHLISLLPVPPTLTPFSLSHPAIPLITTFWHPLPSPGWANIAHFSWGGEMRHMDTPLEVAQEAQESVTEDSWHRLINFHSSCNKAQLCL